MISKRTCNTEFSVKKIYKILLLNDVFRANMPHRPIDTVVYIVSNPGNEFETLTNLFGYLFGATIKLIL